MNIKVLKDQLETNGFGLIGILAIGKLIESKVCRNEQFQQPHVLEGETLDGRKFKLYNDYKDWGQRLDLIVTRLERNTTAIANLLGKNKTEVKVIHKWMDDITAKFDVSSAHRDPVLAIGLDKERSRGACDISRDQVSRRVGFEWTSAGEVALHELMQILETEAEMLADK